MEKFFKKRLPGGTEKMVSVDTAQLALSGDIRNDCDAVAGAVGLVVELKGEYLHRLSDADAAYRAWRGRKTQEILDRDPKCAQWKCDRFIEADPEFLSHKSHIAELEGELEVIRGIFDALRIKSDILKTLASQSAGQRYVERSMVAAEDTTDTAVITDRSYPVAETTSGERIRDTPEEQRRSRLRGLLRDSKKAESEGQE